jgi:hypothetical protein
VIEVTELVPQLIGRLTGAHQFSRSVGEIYIDGYLGEQGVDLVRVRLEKLNGSPRTHADA